MNRSVPLASLTGEDLALLTALFTQRIAALPALSTAILAACGLEVERRQQASDSEPGYLHVPLVEADERTLALYELWLLCLSAGHYGDSEIVDFLKLASAPLCFDATGKNPLASQNEKRDN